MMAGSSSAVTSAASPFADAVGRGWAGEVSGTAIESSVIFALAPNRLTATGAHPERLDKFRHAGFDVASFLDEAAR